MTPEEIAKFEPLCELEAGMAFKALGATGFLKENPFIGQLFADWYRGKELREAAEKVIGCKGKDIRHCTVKGYDAWQDLNKALSAFDVGPPG